MNLKKIGKVFTSKFVGTEPSSYKKRIYRTVVSQRLRNSAIDDLNFTVYGLHTFCSGTAPSVPCLNKYSTVREFYNHSSSYHALMFNLAQPLYTITVHNINVV